MVHRQIQSSSFGRLALPFLLLFLLIYADARVIRCRPDGCVNPTPVGRPLAVSQESLAKISEAALIFPYSESFLNGPPAPATPSPEEQAAQALAEALTAPPAPKGPKSTSTRAAPAAGDGPVAPPRLPTDREVTAADVERFVQQAQRYFRSQQPQNATGVHPKAGGSGSPSDNPGAAPPPAVPSSTSNPGGLGGEGGTASEQGPLVPVPGQGESGTTAPGGLGEPAGGFLG